MCGVADSAAAQPACEPYLAVRTHCGTIDTKLGAFLRVKSGEQDTLFIGAPVSIRVAQEKKIGRTSHNEPVFPRQYAVRKGEAVRKNRAFVHPPVVIHVFKHGNHTHGSFAVRRASRVPTVLRDEKTAALIKRHRARGGGERLGCHQLDF